MIGIKTSGLRTKLPQEDINGCDDVIDLCLMIDD